MAVFGVALKLDAKELPPIITKSIEFFKKTDAYKLEGIFRISGTWSQVDQLKKQWDQGMIPKLDDIEPHVVATCLKLYVRDLPVPLLTYELYDCFLAAASVPISEGSLRSIKSVLKLLPRINFLVIDCLVQMLLDVVQEIQFNKMTATNLAICFAPSLLRAPPECQDVHVLLEDSKFANKLMEMFIEYYDQLFKDDSVLSQVHASPKPIRASANSSSSSSSASSSSQQQQQEERLLSRQDSIRSTKKTMVVPPPSPSPVPFTVPKKPLPLPPSSATASSPSPSSPSSSSPSSPTISSGKFTAPKFPAPTPPPQPPSSRVSVLMSPSSSSSSSPLSSSSENQVIAPSFSESLSSVLLKNFPRVLLKCRGLETFICSDSLGALKNNFKIENSSVNLWESIVEIFKPVWVDSYITFRSVNKVWTVKSNGMLGLEVKKEGAVLEDQHLFSIEFTETDGIVLKSKIYNKYIGYDHLFNLCLVPDENRLTFIVTLKVALRTNKGFFCFSKPSHTFVKASSTCMMLYEMLFIQVEDCDSFCSISHFTPSTGLKYWKWLESKVSPSASSDEDSSECYFQLKVYLKKDASNGGGGIERGGIAAAAASSSSSASSFKVKIFTDTSATLPNVVYCSTVTSEDLSVGPASNSPGALFEMVPYSLKIAEKYRQPFLDLAPEDQL